MMFGLFKAVETPKAFGGWKRYKKCENCNRLEKPFYYDFCGNVCPSCGGENIKIVIARWEESVVSRGVHAVRKLHRHEIKE